MPFRDVAWIDRWSHLGIVVVLIRWRVLMHDWVCLDGIMRYMIAIRRKSIWYYPMLIRNVLWKARISIIGNILLRKDMVWLINVVCVPVKMPGCLQWCGYFVKVTVRLKRSRYWIVCICCRTRRGWSAAVGAAIVVVIAWRGIYPRSPDTSRKTIVSLSRDSYCTFWRLANRVSIAAFIIFFPNLH